MRRQNELCLHEAVRSVSRPCPSISPKVRVLIISSDVTMPTLVMESRLLRQCRCVLDECLLAAASDLLVSLGFDDFGIEFCEVFCVTNFWT